MVQSDVFEPGLEAGPVPVVVAVVGVEVEVDILG